MSMGLLVLAIILIVVFVNLRNKNNELKKEVASTQAALTEATKNYNKAKSELAATTTERDSLIKKYASVIDAEAEAKNIISTARNNAEAKAKGIIDAAQKNADSLNWEAHVELNTARDKAKEIRERAKKAEEKASESTQTAQKVADKIIEDAKRSAHEIAGSAIDAKDRAQEYERIAAAMQRTISGYGDEWIKPAYSILDELAEEFSFSDAGKKLKEAREITARMVSEGIAADCDYIETSRKTIAIQFVIDAFNGKVDSILSKSKRDNYGILEQKIKDAYQLVNRNGMAFRKARILPAYLNARLDELKWAVSVQELKKRAADEQRELRERMREEEKARKEFERAQNEAAKEEAMLQKAMEKARAMLAEASDAQKEKYESQLAELEQKLIAAEEKNKRALSMAQQTKHGTVYVISNVGSFGENVYKVGMTRRLDPMDRVKELGDASVPFPFDVHAFIECDDAPALENALHHDLALAQVNKVNPRKEFFKANISHIKKLVEDRGLEASWTIAAQAAEYRESMAIEERIKQNPSELERWQEFAANSAHLQALPT